MQENKYLISETTKSERIALIKSWIPEDEVIRHFKRSTIWVRGRVYEQQD